MLAHIQTAAVHGVDSYMVRVEVNLTSGLPSFTVVGLPLGAVREGRERVGAALRNLGFPLPPRRITVNLAPADVRKDGTALDLPIAVGLLVAAGHLDARTADGYAFLGELGLDGALRPVRGVLPIAARCRASGVGALVVPLANAPEASVVEGLRVFGAVGLDDVERHLRGERLMAPTQIDTTALLGAVAEHALDLRDVKGQSTAKRALEIAAAGAHNIVFVGPPGSGKTMLARRLAGILPPLTLTEALEATRVHSVAGSLADGAALVTQRPFRAPHHTVSDAGLVGGGVPIRPGEVSLAHHGVLFLDELAEYRRNVLEVLRQPLEDGVVHISRATGAMRFPSRFLMVAAMNPCPCGFWGDGSDRCLCDPGLVARYQGRISGPLMDRIDLHLPVPPVPFDRLAEDAVGPSTAEVRERVCRARRVQTERFAEAEGVHANGQMRPLEIRRWCRTSRAAARLLHDAVQRTGLSARAYHRVLKVARTIADLSECEQIADEHVAEALHYRCLDGGVL